jgi:uncharacterized membrane protein (UPF0127 family)
MKIFRILFSFLGILALCAYAGCALTRTTNMAHTTSPEQTVQYPDSQQAQNLAMKNLTIVTPDGTAGFKVQVADTENTRMTGLMFSKELPAGEGMVFLFDQEQPLTFWMKNTLIPLDMVFIDKDWRVLSIQKQAQPCKKDPCGLYPGSGKAKYVLEINGGLSDKLGIQQGAAVQLQ